MLIDTIEQSAPILISVIMATYNSSGTIGMSLESILKQTVLADQVEIIVVDGGSTDDTRDIAQRYGAIILDNPYRLPEPAKRIGLRHAQGKYVQIMDSDEVLPDQYVFEKRIRLMEENPEVMTLMAGCIAPPGLPACGRYINSIGDPFTAFVYNWYIDGNIGLIKKHDHLHGGMFYIGRFSENDILPIGDSLTTIRRDHLIDRYDDLIETENTSTIVNLIVEDTHLMGHVKGDYVLHYTRSDIKTYLRKLKFRVVNNIYDTNGSGFSARASTNRVLSRRKYLYPFYCMSIVLPLFDGIRMSFYYKHPVFMLHIFFSWYVLVEILYQYGKKIMGNNSKNDVYG